MNECTTNTTCGTELNLTEPAAPPAGQACRLDDGLPRIPAAAQACRECPFRRSNTDREHYGNQYSTEEFTRLWRAIAVEGKLFECHLTDTDHPVPPESQAMGYKKPVDIGARRECAGSVALIRREIRLAMAYNEHADYIRDRPTGLSEQAFRHLQLRLQGELEPAVRFAADPGESDVADPADRIETSSWEWMFSTEGNADMLLVVQDLLGKACDCPVCAGHTTVHRSLPLALPDGGMVEVDQELHSLLTLLVEAGIRTTDSCINITDALERLWPERLPLLRQSIGSMNYSSMVESRAAHIRYNNESPAAQAYTALASQLPAIEVSGVGPVTQLVFAADAIPLLVGLAAALRKVATSKPADASAAARRPPSDYRPAAGKRNAAGKQKGKRK